MIELDSSLAQHIVDRAMAILPHNINVMDVQGMIIGTGNPARLHTRHEGAQLVLANRRVVEIDAQTAACLRGVQPGVNLPLMHGDRLIGVLGITGDPAIVRAYGELLRMAAEMLVEQRRHDPDHHWQQFRIEGWWQRLLDDGADLAALERDAERMGLVPAWPSQLVVLELNDEAAAADIPALLEGLGARPGRASPLGARLLVWWRGFRGSDEHAWLARADDRGWPVARLFCSGSLARLSDLRAAGQALLLLQEMQLPTASRIVHLDDHRLETLLYAHRDHWLLEGWMAPLKQLQAEDPDGLLRQTLACWCRHDGQAQACAEVLGIHRNTLRYRLDRIAELSKIDPRRRDLRTQMALGLSLLR